MCLNHTGRFSTSANVNEKILIANNMMRLFKNHIASHGEDEFVDHFLEFERRCSKRWNENANLIYLHYVERHY